jgi:hypothetical protein
MLTTTFLNMIVIPTLYLRYGRPVEVAEEEWDAGSESATV